jgi:hypothetical protein
VLLRQCALYRFKQEAGQKPVIASISQNITFVHKFRNGFKAIAKFIIQGKLKLFTSAGVLNLRSAFALSAFSFPCTLNSAILKRLACRVYAVEQAQHFFLRGVRVSSTPISCSLAFKGRHIARCGSVVVSMKSPK